MVQIKDYLPMRTDMRVTFYFDGSIVRLPEIVLFTDGARSMVNGYVNFSDWPDMVYNVDSRVNLWRMREIFFAKDSWRSRGDARFKGVFQALQGRPPADGRLRVAARARQPVRLPGPARIARVGAAPLRGDCAPPRGSTTAAPGSAT